ncbi:MAG: phosphoribosylglycinamide formyltransferase [Methylacidiphilales bacterium]|nr:phosphoribosylglycinamide formyltransferase [Candidatus Methylacidiphilales bacterium]MDW8349440.1 phosphoribosylglycinamide formyltransferase [Verrucomicrobiae bacterium]
MKPLLRLGVLGSGKGSNFLAIHEAIQAGKLHAEIRLVVSDREDAGIVEHARRLGYPIWVLPLSRYKTRLEPELEGELVERLREAGCEWVILAGYMRVVKAPLLEAYRGRILNIHPSLLPDFKGLEAWKQALAAGVKKTGCTVHYVDESLDGGEILAQREVPVWPDDTPEELHRRIQEAEHILYPEVLEKLWQKEHGLTLD